MSSHSSRPEQRTPGVRHRLRRSLVPLVALPLLLAACGDRQDNGSGSVDPAPGASAEPPAMSSPPAATVPTVGLPTTTRPADCTGARTRILLTRPLSDFATASVDRTVTTLLIKNTSELVLTVAPDDASVLQRPQPDDPHDSASGLATSLLTDNGFSSGPAAGPSPGTVLVPPGWTVCATSVVAGRSADVRVRADWEQSISWQVANHAIQQLVQQVSVRQVKQSQVVRKCVEGAVSVARSSPAQASDSEVYLQAIDTTGSCHEAIKDFLEGVKGPSAVEETETGLSRAVEKLPALTHDARFFTELAHFLPR